jgi:hypothetical protein
LTGCPKSPCMQLSHTTYCSGRIYPTSRLGGIVCDKSHRYLFGHPVEGFYKIIYTLDKFGCLINRPQGNPVGQKTPTLNQVQDFGAGIKL